MQRYHDSGNSYGFTLIEVLLALLVFAIGILGTSSMTANALTEIADNNGRAIALNAASQQLESLYLAAGKGNTAFKTELDTLIGGMTVTTNNGRDSFTITIDAGQDSNDAAPADLLTSATPASWVSPLTIAASVTFAGINGTKTTQASYTFITTGP